jgi:hypothetical protein
MATKYPPRLGYQKKMTAEDILGLHAASDDTSVVVWSMQQPGAIDRLMQEGKLSGDPRFAFVDETHNWKRFGYVWMQEQMARRITGYKQELPIWALLVPPSFSDRENDTLLRIEIPKSRMLISFYLPWTELEPAFAYLWNMQEWRDHWVTIIHPYAAVDATDLQKNVFVGPHGQRRTEWNEVECRASWERMFDLTFINREDFRWGLTLQTMIPYVLSDDVKDMRPLSKRAN